MSYVQQHLNPGEKVVHHTTLHPIIFIAGALLSLLALPFFAGSKAASAGAFLLIIAALVLLVTWLRFTTSEFAVTTSRVIIKTGWLSRKTLELQLAKVEALAVEQGLLGQMLDYGTLVVGGTGGTKEKFTRIKGPVTFRQRVHAQIETQARATQTPSRGSLEASPGVSAAREERECPHCAERILIKAIRCRFCGQPVTPLVSS